MGGGREGRGGRGLKRRINPFVRSDNCWISEDKNFSQSADAETINSNERGESTVVAADYLPLIPRAESIPRVSRLVWCPE